MSKPDAATFDRAAGALLGLACGDALGAGYEFRPNPPPDPQMIGGGLGHWAPGEWTDDTQMAICIAEVTATGTVDLDAIGENFLAWYRAGQKDVGIQTSSVLRRASTSKDLPARAADYYEANPSGSAGNGSLMRTAPVALAHLGDDHAIVESARAVSALTHADPLAQDACALWCIAIDRAVREARLDGVRDGLKYLSDENRALFSDWLDEAEDKPPAAFKPNGFSVRALQAAHAAITQTPVPTDTPCAHLTDALAAAVAIGDDTDTVAAIAGGLLGARWGASAIPMQWRALIHGWPGHRANDLTRLAHLTARHGQPDANGWPATQSLRDHYAADYPAEPIAVALEDEPGVIVGNVPGLFAASPAPDLVISLCRMGIDDRPVGAQRLDPWLIDSADPAANPNLDFVIADLAATIADWRKAGGTVFVHCVRAESRTPTVAAAYLAIRLGISGVEALDRVRHVLPHARPNAAFVAALERLWPSP